MPLLMSLVAMASAATVYVNGVAIDTTKLPGTVMDQVNVVVDANGDLRITAPGFELPSAVQTPSAQPSPPQPTSVPLPMNPNGVPKATWWLATEDNGSTGHVVDVFINGALAYSVRSGEPQRIVDVGSHMRLGPNAIRIRSQSSNPGGGTLYMYIGRGQDMYGTVHLDSPEVQFGVGASRQGEYIRDYELDVAQ